MLEKGVRRGVKCAGYFSTSEVRLYYQFSPDGLVPQDHLLYRIASATTLRLFNHWLGHFSCI